LAEFRFGAGGIADLGRFINNENLVLSNRLDAIEIAMERGIINIEELTSRSPEPLPSEFGLESEERPSVFPCSLRNWVDQRRETIIAALMLCGMASVVLFIYVESQSIMLAFFGALFGGLIGGFLLTSVVCGAIALIERAAPGIGRWRQFQAAKQRWRVISAARIVWSLGSDVRAFERASGPEFERLTARAFRRLGYFVEEVGGANDGGIDLVIRKGSMHGIVQCKAHGKPLGPAVVRELHGTLSHSKASRAFLVTNHGVSENAREWAKGKPIVFLQPDHLIKGFN
jgi:hypothetical protein